MRFIITFEPEGDYKHVWQEHIQSWFYAQLEEFSPELSRELYSNGIRAKNGRIFKPFVFSRLYTTRKSVCLKLSVVTPQLIFAVSRVLSTSPVPLVAPHCVLRIKDVNLKEFRNTKKFFTLSPILLKTEEGNFKDAIKYNLLGKYEALYKKDYTGKIYLDFDYMSCITVRYKTEKYVGLVGEFVLVADDDLVEVAYHMGVGPKNGCGFGCVETVN